jgi:DNA polymerase III subunit epsilon
MRGMFLDFEATDKDITTARITQVAFSVFDLKKQKELFHYSTLVLPEGKYEISETAGAITGITADQLSEFGASLRKVLEIMHKHLMGVEYLIAHNLLAYDYPLLQHELKRLNREEFQLPALIDSRFDVPWPSHIETRKLSYLGAEFGIVNPSAHSARHDVDILAKLFFMFPIEETIERSKSPMIWVRADVSFNDKDKARDRRFMWNPTKKIWVKQFKQCDFEKESFDFRTIILHDYEP